MAYNQPPPQQCYPPPQGGGYPADPSMGGYPPQGHSDPMHMYFHQVAGPDGQIDASELSRALTSSGIAGPVTFSTETARIMISLLDRDCTGTMGFNEFKELWNSITQWKGIFTQYDRDHSGTIESFELEMAVRIGLQYNLSPQAYDVLCKRYQTKINGRWLITFDNFLALAVRLRALSDGFRRKDQHQNGWAQLQYDEFIRLTMAF